MFSASTTNSSDLFHIDFKHHYLALPTSIIVSTVFPNVQYFQTKFIMFNSLILSFILLRASTVFAATTVEKAIDHPFTLFAWYSNAPGLGANINANGGSFWLRKNTSSSCPESVKPNCPVGNVTSFVAGDTTGTLFLNAAVPGGQQGGLP
jgi:hypothetical protein